MCLDVKKRTINMCEGSCTHMKEIKKGNNLSWKMCTNLCIQYIHICICEFLDTRN